MADNRNNGYGYGYWSWNGSKVECKPGLYLQRSCGNSYGCKFDQSDIIKVKLNLKTKQLGFSINDKDQGIAFNHIECNEDIKYRLGVSLTQRDSSVSIIKFNKKIDDGQLL